MNGEGLRWVAINAGPILGSHLRVLPYGPTLGSHLRVQTQGPIRGSHLRVLPQGSTLGSWVPLFRYALYDIYSDKHFQQLVLQQISRLLPAKQMQIHNNYEVQNNMNMNTSDKHFQQLLLQQIEQLLQMKQLH